MNPTINSIKSFYPADVVERNLARGGRFSSGLFADDVKKDSLGEAIDPRYNSSVIVKAGSPKWEQSPKFDEFMSDLAKKRNAVKNALTAQGKGANFNAAQFPSDYYSFVNLLRLDITRRRIEAADMTNLVAQETTRLDASKSILFDEFLPFVGAFEEFKGRGDKVPMMQHKTGKEGSALVKLYGLGDVRTLEDELFDSDIYSLSKVADAFVRAFVALRNDLTIGKIVGYTYPANQSQVADTTGATYDEKLYLTINNAIELLRGLIDPTTLLPIDASRMTLMCAYADERKINRVINGQLDNSKGKAINLQPLTEVTEIWPYKGDTITVGDRKYSYAGVTKGTAFLFVPGSYGAPNYVVTKRPLTYETGRGDLFSAARDGQIAYFGQAQYSDEFFGEAAGLVSGSGYVVKITLP
jgi:hypothetical protein